jgi:hypothetical protein
MITVEIRLTGTPARVLAANAKAGPRPSAGLASATAASEAGLKSESKSLSFTD